MQRITAVVLLLVVVCGVVWAQGGSRVSATEQTGSSAEVKSYKVRLTEFRMAATEGKELTEAEILRAFVEASSTGTLDVVNTFNLTVAEGGQASLHHGAEVPILTGLRTADGSLRSQIQYRSVGKSVNIRFEPNSPTLLRIGYESSSVEEDEQDADSPNFLSFRIETHVNVETGTPILLGSGTTFGGRYLVVTVEE